MSTSDGFNLPPAVSRIEEFRERLAAGEIGIQRCSNCGDRHHPPRAWCPVCLSREYEWIPLDGPAMVYAMVWYHEPIDARYPDTPYNVAVVSLDGGVNMVSTILGLSPGEDVTGSKVTGEIIRSEVSGALTVGFRLAPE